MKYTNLQVEQMTSFIIFESAHINITPCVNLGTGGENIHTVLLGQFKGGETMRVKVRLV